jgi:hypothetical protein
MSQKFNGLLQDHAFTGLNFQARFTQPLQHHSKPFHHLADGTRKNDYIVQVH